MVKSSTRLPNWLAPLGLGFILGCAAPNPMSISLYHPKAKIARTCAVRDSGGLKAPEALSGAVEACAKQLEARGFVRVDELPDIQKPTASGATIP